jgi:hypothetical protein
MKPDLIYTYLLHAVKSVDKELHNCILLGSIRNTYFEKLMSKLSVSYRTFSFLAYSVGYHHNFVREYISVFSFFFIFKGCLYLD